MSDRFKYAQRNTAKIRPCLQRITTFSNPHPSKPGRWLGRPTLSAQRSATVLLNCSRLDVSRHAAVTPSGGISLLSCCLLCLSTKPTTVKSESLILIVNPHKVNVLRLGISSTIVATLWVLGN
ncbi:hypothetical protein GALMADRAFT_514635 [Galerina marginata CBS 339.88]|uniref:Uncharacterized protein n=1 Tax=Galerina marginata (strain CBS 339.88) TaxID=685588 RepID=A0A067SYG7_GALM3|nr:hypothetical protein GALMADRAFT_514635 [Galerina marginata CBS 339.88]